MGFWIMFILWLASTILGELLRPKPKVDNAKPAGLGDFQFPTASEARPIPVVFGTVDVTGPNVVWYGALRCIPITKKVKTGMKKHVHQTIGYKYRVGMHAAICHSAGTAELLRIRFAEKVAWSGTARDTTIHVDKEDLFGGDDREGGVEGYIDVCCGGAVQVQNPYLVSKIGDTVPAYRGLMALVMKDFYVGTSTYLKAPEFRVKDIPTGLQGGPRSDIGGDANPAEIIYAVLTNARWGMGMDPGLLDLASFRQAADALYTEGFGLSLIWDNRTSCEDFIAEVLRHIDGVVFPDLATGRLTLKLARDDYSIGALPVFDPSNVEKITNFSRTAWDETTNEVRVVYIDRATSKERTCICQDMANWATQGAVVSSEIRYQGVTNPALASRLSQRDLKSLTYPLAKGTMIVNRSGSSRAPASCFVLTWPDLGISQVVCRVLRVRYGELQSGTIEIDFTQDIFSLASSVFSDPEDTGWEDPVHDPADVTVYKLTDMPYLVQYQRYGEPDGTKEYPMLAASPPSDDTWSFDLMVSANGAPYDYQGEVMEWCPTGTLSTGIGPTDTTLVLENGPLMELTEDAVDQDQGDTLFLLGDELMTYAARSQDPATGRWTLTGVWRGLLDTVPASHAAGARAFFFCNGTASPPNDYAAGDALALKMLTITPKGKLAIGDATPRTITLAGRSVDPYPPGKFLLNTAPFPSFITGELVISWAHRDRLLQTAYLVQQNAGDVGPEAGTTYTVRIYGEGGALKHTEAGLTGTTYTYPLATEISEGGLSPRPNERLRVTVTAYRDGRACWQAQDWTFECHGYGMFYGDSYGE